MTIVLLIRIDEEKHPCRPGALTAAVADVVVAHLAQLVVRGVHSAAVTVCLPATSAVSLGYPRRALYTLFARGRLQLV
jgi:hypothetical protein